MSNASNNPVPNPADHKALGRATETLRNELQDLTPYWWWLLLLGVALVVLGTAAIGVPIFVSVATVIFLGAFLLVAGVGQVISAFWAGKWSGFLLQLLVGIFYVVVAVLILDEPATSVLALTLLIAVFLVVSGIFRIASSLTLKFHGWGWHLLCGVVTLMLGVLITKVLREDVERWRALMVIGLFVGIEMIFNGWTWVMLALQVRRLGLEEASAEADA